MERQLLKHALPRNPPVMLQDRYGLEKGRRSSPSCLCPPSSSLSHSTFTCHSVVMHLIFVFPEGGRRSLDARRGKMVFRATWWACLWGESALRTVCLTRSPGTSRGSPGPTGHNWGVSWQACLLPWLPRRLRHTGQSWRGGCVLPALSSGLCPYPNLSR